MLVRNLLQNRDHQPKVMTADLTVLQAARFLKAHKIGGAPVVDADGRLTGFCSERDLVFRLLAGKGDPEQTLVGDIMSKRLVTATLDDSVVDCEAKLRAAHCRHLPILDSDRIVACLSLRDFLQQELKEAELENQQLKDYIQGG